MSVCQHETCCLSFQLCWGPMWKRKGERILCQKGLDSCKNINMIEHNPNKFVFNLWNVGPEAMEFTYQCEITVTIENVDHTERGTPTKLKPDFAVIQHQFQTASISCEHDAEGFPVKDVQLYRIPQTGQEVMLCRKGQDFCRDIDKYPHNPRKFVFILLNVGPEAMDFTYQCAITVAVGNTDYTERGTPIKLQQEKDSPSSNELTWILIGLLALVFFYSCVITCLYVRLTVTIWKNSRASENSTYVEMKPPNQKSQYEDIYHMQMSSA
ncbi:uncharacterized protein LOC124871785 isoform X2 [Girardinichthys multiradiatus]|uniref:uncharacterized protein LOC124871785 isoform X2 n=1 Tax=Girardinichthys multiradiatus TaxID=208333 RepID=UPI001FACE840|nr:uncharacterized protein LOC124871785 isoform X2 [Girardinichthys multiradiatus]